MQALILFMVFGAFAATIGGVITYSSNSTIAFIQQTINAQKQSFDDLSTVINGSFSPTYLDLPLATGITDPSTYLCAHTQTAQLLNCTVVAGKTIVLDQWGNAVTGYMQRFPNIALASSGAGGFYSVKAPVTAFALVSAGPDGKIDARLQADLSALGGGASGVNSVVRLSAYRQATGSAGDSLDDIVATFSNQSSQEDALAGYQGNLDRIAAAALLSYQGQFRQFQPNLATVYAGQFNTGTININDATLQRWRTLPVSGTTLPTFTAASLDAFGATPEINEVQRGLCAPGAANCPNFALGMQGTDTTLNFWLVPQNGLPWTITGNTSISTPPAGCTLTPAVNCMQVYIKGS